MPAFSELYGPISSTSAIIHGNWAGLPRITSILTARFLINLQEVKQRLAGSSRSLSGELEFQHVTSEHSGGFFDSFGGEISFHSDYVGDNDEEAVEVAAEADDAVVFDWIVWSVAIAPRACRGFLHGFLISLSSLHNGSSQYLSSYPNCAQESPLSGSLTESCD